MPKQLMTVLYFSHLSISFVHFIVSAFQILNFEFQVFLHTVKKLFVVLAQLRCAFQLHPAYTDIAELLCDIIDSALTVGIFHM